MPAEHWLEAEILDIAVLHEQDLDVLAADVADDVDVGEPALRAHHVRDGLDDVRVGAERALEDVAGVAGHAEPGHLELRALLGRHPRIWVNMSFMSWIGLPFESV